MSNRPHPVHVFDRPQPRPKIVTEMTIRIRPKEAGRKLTRRAKRQLKKERST